MGFFKRPLAQAGWIIAGLGNPGKQYEGSRHNAGFWALDEAAKAWGIEVRRSGFKALYGKGRLSGQSVVLLKPQTFMNLSGQSIRAACDFFKTPPERVLVLFDDVSLEPGILRVRLSGSAGGHNGLKSIIAAIGEAFPRVKIGVGQKPTPEYDLAGWVLAKPPGPDRDKIAARLEDVAKAAELVVAGNAAEAMSRYNGAGL